MKVELEINDRVWADFCIWLEDNHARGCICCGNPSLHLSTQIARSLLRFKTEKQSIAIAKATEEGILNSLNQVLEAEEEAVAELKILAKEYGVLDEEIS